MVQKYSFFGKAEKAKQIRLAELNSLKAQAIKIEFLILTHEIRRIDLFVSKPNRAERREEVILRAVDRVMEIVNWPVEERP